MPRNGSGTFSPSTTFTADALADAADVNAAISDLGDEVTNSVAADGQTTMTGPFKASDGSASAPGITFSADTNTGFYRSATGTIRATCDGTNVWTLSATGMTVTGDASISGDLTVSGTITGTLAANAVVTASITDGAVTTAKLADSSVTAAKVVEGSGSLRSVPQSAKTTSYTLIAADNGRHISITTGGVTVPQSVFAAGDTVTIYNNSGSAQTITEGSGATMYLVGTATTGNRTLAQRGLCTVMCVASNTFVITGGGVS